MPKRIQCSNVKGWRMPEGAIYVGRPRKWGNPYIICDFGGAPLVVGPDSAAHHIEDDKSIATARRLATDLFRRHWEQSLHHTNSAIRLAAQIALDPLRGRDLACWCPLVDKDGNPVPCHADVLLEIANAPR